MLPLETRKHIEVIGVFDVLEHIPESTKFTSQLLGACPNTKLLVVTVPARQEIWTNFDEYYGHCRRYSPRQLDDEMMCVGLEKVCAGYFSTRCILPICFLKLSLTTRKSALTRLGIVRTLFSQVSCRSADLGILLNPKMSAWIQHYYRLCACLTPSIAMDSTKKLPYAWILLLSIAAILI